MHICTTRAGWPAEWFANSPAGGSTHRTGANAFEKQILSMISGELERLSAGSESLASANLQHGALASASSHLLDTPAPSPDNQSASTNPSPPATGEPEVIARLRMALQAAGYDPEKFNLVYQEQQVFFPGGNYVDRGITATFDNGYQETYGADLTMESPYATVLSIEHTLRDIAAGTYY